MATLHPRSPVITMSKSTVSAPQLSDTTSPGAGEGEGEGEGGAAGWL